VAQALLQALYAHCHHVQARALWLEVRPSNERARALYRREGFSDIGVRRHYYPAESGREDAWVMRRDLAPEVPHALD
jgi:ribosomal protein S18 acetylase RimI-like enzyme